MPVDVLRIENPPYMFDLFGAATQPSILGVTGRVHDGGSTLG